MSQAVPPLLLTRIKQEETNTEVDCVLAADKRPFGWLTPQHEHGSTKSDFASIGNEWQPTPSRTSSTLSNKARIPLLPPSAASTLPTYQLNTTQRSSSFVDVLTTGVFTTANTLEVQYPKCEAEDPFCMKRTEGSEGECSLKPQSHECEICGQVFSRTGSKNMHIRSIHKGLRPFVCEICGRDFARMSIKKSHVDSVHKKVRKFACEFCGKASARRPDLKIHIKAVHKELRDFVCEFCEKAFAERSKMTRHIKAVHKELREFACEFCGKAFAQRSNMKIHIKTIHGEPT